MDAWSTLTAEERALVEFAIGIFVWEARHRNIPLNLRGSHVDVAEARVQEQLAQWLLESRPK